MPSTAVRYSVLEVNMGGNRLVSPPPPRFGRPGDFASGEWDTYYELSDAQRRFIRRNLCGGDLAPDQVAQAMGLDVEAFWAQLSVAVGAAIDNRAVVTYDDSTATVSDLMGPSEAADYFGVQTCTIAQWRNRSARGQIDPPFPLPVAELSGRLIWDVRDLERWGLETSRLEMADAAGF